MLCFPSVHSQLFPHKSDPNHYALVTFSLRFPGVNTYFSVFQMAGFPSTSQLLNMHQQSVYFHAVICVPPVYVYKPNIQIQRGSNALGPKPLENLPGINRRFSPGFRPDKSPLALAALCTATASNFS